jgi:hypothetical protein
MVTTTFLQRITFFLRASTAYSLKNQKKKAYRTMNHDLFRVHNSATEVSTLVGCG